MKYAYSRKEIVDLLINELTSGVGYYKIGAHTFHEIKDKLLATGNKYGEPKEYLLGKDVGSPDGDCDVYGYENKDNVIITRINFKVPKQEDKQKSPLQHQIDHLNKQQDKPWIEHTGIKSPSGIETLILHNFFTVEGYKKTKQEDECQACKNPLGKYIHTCKNHQKLNSKQEDKKECKGIMGTDCPYGNPDCPICHKPTPSPLDSIEDIEEPYYYETGFNKLDLGIAINSLIRNQTKIISYLKGKK